MCMVGWKISKMKDKKNGDSNLKVKVKHQPKHIRGQVAIESVALTGKNTKLIKAIVILSLLAYLIIVIILAVALQQYAIFIMLILLGNVIFLWFFGRMATKLMLFPNSNWLVSSFMSRSLYK